MFLFPFVTEAYAQDAAGAGGAGNAIIQFVPFILIFAVFYFLIIRPQQKRQKEHQAMLGNLQKGDKVVTSSGIYGSIVKMGDDRITLEIAPKVNVVMDRSQISRLDGSGSSAKEESKDSKKEESKDSKDEKDSTSSS